MLLKSLFTGCCAVLFSSAVSAAVIVGIDTDIASGGVDGDPHSPSFTVPGPSSSDLIQGMSPSGSTDVGNPFTEEVSTGLAALTDGSADTFYGGGTASSSHTAYLVGSDGDSVTYALGGTYDLTSIVVYGGWNDGGRDQQHYNVLTSTDGATFSVLSSVDTNPGVQGTDTTPVSTQVSFSEDTLAYISENVTHVRLDFLGVENGYTGYTELDVFGVAVPEPTSLALLGLSVAGVFGCRRKS